jgi:hypothetical protein
VSCRSSKGPDAPMFFPAKLASFTLQDRLPAQTGLLGGIGRISAPPARFIGFFE